MYTIKVHCVSLIISIFVYLIVIYLFVHGFLYICLKLVVFLLFYWIHLPEADGLYREQRITTYQDNFYKHVCENIEIDNITTDISVQ